MSENPHVLVVYASAHGSTATIANHIAATLTAADVSVHTASVDEDPDPRSFGGVVLGSAIHDRDFLPAFRAYLDRRHTALSTRPTWLFSVGMGPALRGPVGARLGRMVPKPIARIRDTLGVNDYHAFAGVFERPPERRTRLIIRLLGAHYGDNRDFADVATWASRIAGELR